MVSGGRARSVSEWLQFGYDRRVSAMQSLRGEGDVGKLAWGPLPPAVGLSKAAD